MNRPARRRQGRRPEPPAPSTKLFFSSRFSRSKAYLTRPFRNVDGGAVVATLRGAILYLPYVRHCAKQPYSHDHQHRKEAEHDRVLDVAVALVFRRPFSFLSTLAHRSITPLADRNERRRNNR